MKVDKGERKKTGKMKGVLRKIKVGGGEKSVWEWGRGKKERKGKKRKKRKGSKKGRKQKQLEDTCTN